ncbi:MAG TPA: prolyl oligopeptidase family serine peptidase [Thermoanaerobaculia bacterium]|nr:prolyl oligopeptidase family serine peptidase [Thermoanaerobaculia bacterium]
MRSSRFAMLGAGLLLLLTLIPVFAARAATSVTPAVPDSTASVYRTPAKALADLVDAPPTPGMRLDPKREWMLLLDQPSLPPIAELAERELRLGGLRIRPRNHGPSRTGYSTGLRLLRISDLAERRVTGLPEAARLENVRFAPDGARFSFTHTGANGIELWIGEVATGQAHRLGTPQTAQLNLAAGSGPQWLRDGSLVTTLVVPDQGPEPPAPSVPAGPVLQENRGKTAPARTYQDLLKSAYDEALFEYYLTSQVARIAADGTVTPLGKPGLVAGVSPSPDGRYLLVTTLHRPFSYLVPADRFPRRTEVWDLEGHAVHTVADLPLQEEIPITFGSVATGPRDVTWRDDAPATLCWVEALDGGDAGREAAERDRVLLLAAPFQGEPATLATLGMRFAELTWGNDGLALLSESWWKTRRTRTWIVRPGGPKAPPELLFDRSFEDRYSDPGNPMTIANAWGRPVLQTADGGKAIFLSGLGASAEGDRPFLDAFDLRTKKARRLFRSEAPYFEDPAEVLDADGRYVLVRREAVEEPPNWFVRDLKTGKLRQLTRFPHPTPQLLGIHKELLRYSRPDGVQLTGTLYTPAGWKPADGPLPMVMWAYPQEFKSASAAGQVSGSPYRFARAYWSSPLVWLTQGYAVLDDPSLPIVGEGDKEPNDSYVDQLVASAKAAVDEVVKRGVADRRRIAIGGHSYGAFTTANLLAHSDLFAAGIAESGAYNRTLTPFGFQSEERDLWHAEEVYMKMSPFLYADKIRRPLLLVHGQADNNPGTDPIQSDRFYNALKGNGATVRLVVLPFESHGYRARESALHLLWESSNWLDTYVKNRPVETSAAQP